MWQGRNSIFALALGDRLFVLARVQNSFYNTFFSDNGEDWFEVEGACALANVQVDSAVAFPQLSLLSVVSKCVCVPWACVWSSCGLALLSLYTQTSLPPPSLSNTL